MRNKICSGSPAREPRRTREPRRIWCFRGRRVRLRAPANAGLAPAGVVPRLIAMSTLMIASAMVLPFFTGNAMAQGYAIDLAGQTPAFVNAPIGGAVKPAPRQMSSRASIWKSVRFRAAAPVARRRLPSYVNPQVGGGYTFNTPGQLPLNTPGRLPFNTPGQFLPWPSRPGAL